MKALILSCNTGGGHNTAGRAVEEELMRRGIECKFKDALAFGGDRASEIVSDGYINCAKKVPKLFGHLYNAGAAVSAMNIKSPVYIANTFYAKQMYRYIMSGGYDTIFCPHLFPCEALSYIRKHFKTDFKCYGVQTDYTCIPFWGEPEMDAFFAPHKDLVDECVEKGIKREKVVVTGIPVSMRFYDKPTKKAARETLSLPQDKEIYLVMTGSMGFGNMTDLVKNIIIEGKENTYVVALVGSNEELKKELLTAIPREKLLCVDFTNDVPVYMSACDVLLTKPGGLSSTEAAACNVPFIHTAPIPGCETKNALFFANMGASICKETPEDSAKAAVSLIKDKTAQQKMLIAQRENINPFAARDIVDYAIANANL